jgi:hypothetical protein
MAPAHHHRAMPRLVWFTGLASLGLFAGLAWYLAPLEPGVLALQFAFTPKAFAAIVHAWPAEHLEKFRAHLPIDCALLLGYGCFGYLLASRSKLFARSSRAARCAATWALPLAAAFDAAENALQGWLTAVPRFGVTLPYFAAALCSIAKWMLLAGFAIAVAHALTRSED